MQLLDEDGAISLVQKARGHCDRRTRLVLHADQMWIRVSREPSDPISIRKLFRSRPRGSAAWQKPQPIEGIRVLRWAVLLRSQRLQVRALPGAPHAEKHVQKWLTFVIQMLPPYSNKSDTNNPVTTADP